MTIPALTRIATSRFTGPLLIAFRIGWIAIALLIAVLLVLGLPPQFDEVMASPEYAPEVINPLGLSSEVVTTYDVILDLLTLGVLFFIAVMLFVRRSDERIALLTSLMLITWGSTTLTSILYALANTNPAILLPIEMIKAVGQALLVYFGYTFPTGKHNPKWTRWIVQPFGVWIILSALMPSLPFSYASLPGEVSFAIELAIYLGAVAVQVYRFRRVLTEEQVQQAKWVVAGMVAAIFGFVAVALPRLFIPSLTEVGITSFWYEIFLQTFLLFSLTAIPIGIGLSILRYRLWDVDFIINRSVVYGALTLILGAIFGGLVVAFEAILTAITGGAQSTVAVSAAATVIGFSFNPARKWLRRWVDRRIYGIRVDYRQQNPQNQSPLGASHTGQTFGTRIGTYEIEQSIGWGGMSEVYRARQLSLNRDVAIKMLNPGMVFDAEARSRFEREARALAALKHPNILEIYDFGEHEDIFYMVIEYIPGDDLGQVIKEGGAMSLDDTCALIRQIASALDYAHGQGIVHRDVKPANVLLKRKSSGEAIPILADFGVARLKQQAQLTSGMVGTVDYIAPEQIRNLPDLDGRADVYSLGVMAYQMLTGQLPFVQNNTGARLMAHLQAPPPDPRDLRPDLGDRVSAAIQRAMAKERDHRYATAGEFASALCE